MILLLQDMPLRRELIRTGLERAARFRWERTAQQYLEVFEASIWMHSA